MNRVSGLAILILAHANVGVFGRLVAALDHPDIALFCHIDAGVDVTVFEMGSAGRVTFIRDRVAISWGGFSMIEAELRLLRAAQQAGPFASYVIISGDSLPLLASDALVSLLSPIAYAIKSARQLPVHGGYVRFDRVFLPDTSIGGFRGKAYFERYLKTEDFPLIRRAMASTDNVLRKSLLYFKTTQWIGISNHYLSQMLTYLAANPDFEELFRFTAMPDESFFPTLLHVIEPGARNTFDLMGVDWTRKPLPYVFRSEQDLPVVLANHCPFFRKFSDECLSLVDKVLANRKIIGQIGEADLARYDKARLSR